MSAEKCMTYQARIEFMNSFCWKMAGELMQLHPIDRLGVLADVPKALEKALKVKEGRECA